MKLRKVAALVMAAIMSMSLMACGSDTAETKASEAGNEGTQTEASAADAAGGEPDTRHLRLLL